MPYAEPTSPIPSPVKETTSAGPSSSSASASSSSRKGWFSPPSHIEDLDDGAPGATGPMMGIPRRSSSSAVVPRRTSPAISRNGSISNGNVFTASKPMEGLPRRMSNPGASGNGTANGNGPAPAIGLAGLPAESSSLGLKLLPSPQKAPLPVPRQSLRGGPKDSMSSVSTQEDSLPPTPADEPISLPPTSSDVFISKSTPTIPAYTQHQPPPKGTLPTRSAMSPGRPTLSNNRRRSGSPGTGVGSLLTNRTSHMHSGSLQINIASSSTTQLPAPTSSSLLSPIPRPASMVRKKSGEVVKPSLKHRSMSTPDLSRQGEDVYPSTPEDERERGFPEERSKSVRFAGADEADGGTLENVVLFLREQKPIAVSRAADPDRANLTETETECDTDAASDFVQFRTRRNAAAQKADDDRLVMEGGSRVPRVRLDFSGEPSELLKDEHVVLERVELQADTGPLQLKGTALVKNVSFQKWVAIRFTLDHWQTVSEVAGAHVTHIPSETTGDEGWDRFSFSIKLEDYKRKLDERQLMMCIRFSVDGREWWDSNNGLNYNFTFRKATPRRARPNSFGSSTFMRMKMDMNENGGPIGLRQDRNANSAAAQIKKAFGAKGGPVAATGADGPASWVFPRTQEGAIPARPDSPLATAPPEAFSPPVVPDVHAHLSLTKTYCAPSPPSSSPSVDTTPALPTITTPPTMVTSPESEHMAILAGGYATLTPPKPSMHGRRSSWNGNDVWSSFGQAIHNGSNNESTSGAAGSCGSGSGRDSDTPHATDGETTPIAGPRSPRLPESSAESSPEARPLSMKRSPGHLQALLTGNDDAGLFTPPSSDPTSPVSPMLGLPHMPISPSDSSVSSIVSTGDSSPNTVTSYDSALDIANMAIHVDPMERGRNGNAKMLNHSSYQEFIDKFCFFQSPRMTPSGENPIYTRAPHLPPSSGTASPNGFPFYMTHSSSSPRSTPTPTRQYDSANDAFAFSAALPAPSPMNIPSPRREHGASTSASYTQQTTPKGSPMTGAIAGNGITGGNNHPLTQYALGQPMSDRWALGKPEQASPTMTAAQ